MGFLSQYVRHTLKGPKKQPKPKPDRMEMATVGGVVHRLIWVNRSKGNYQLSCRCGWVGMTARDEITTTYAGNSHIHVAVNSGAASARNRQIMDNVRTEIENIAKIEANVNLIESRPDLSPRTSQLVQSFKATLGELRRQVELMQQTPDVTDKLLNRNNRTANEAAKLMNEITASLSGRP